ncbi:MAG: amidohydrolase family protein [Bacteroidota bacterium]|nr:amidohydrolase family protein [Bacteroidota bacterium]
MRKLSADYVFSPEGKFVPKAVITVNSTGEIINFEIPTGDFKETAGLEYYNGILVPGFINAHCHSELSHMKGVVSPGKALPEFIDEVIKKRNSPDKLKDKIARADLEMKAEGIVAVGDISNNSDSFEMKKNSSIYYHTFIEMFITNDTNIAGLKETARQTKKALNDLPGSFVPHAPYTVSDKLFSTINELNAGESKVISIHNQETRSEDELFLSQRGKLYEQMKKIGFNYKDFHFTDKNSLQSTLPKLAKDKNILLIHNSYTQEADINFAENYSDSVYWVFCPASNLYIENQLPNYPLFFNKKLKTCIGTDSYASNTKLSVIHELKIISENYPEIDLAKLINTACINGAKALNIEHKYGDFSIGKTPGINLITGIDYKTMSLSSESDVEALV